MASNGLSSSTLLWSVTKMQSIFSIAASLSLLFSSLHPAAVLLLRLHLPSSLFLSEMLGYFPFSFTLHLRLNFSLGLGRDLSDLLVKYLDGRFQPL